MATHSFDPNVDEVYDVDAYPEVYLTEAQVATAAAAIACATQKDEVAKEYVIKIEAAQRDRCAGRISDEECARISKTLNERFRAQFGTWIYQSQFARKFYANFGVCES